LKKALKISALIILGVILIIAVKNVKTKSKTSNEISIVLPYRFSTEKAEQLSADAFELTKSGKLDEAISLYQKAIAIEPSNPKLFFDVAECYSKKTDFSSSLLMLEKAILLDSTNAFFYNNRGLVHWKLKEDQKAISDYKKAIELNGSIWVIYSNLSIAYHTNRNPIEACKAFNKAIGLGLMESAIDNDKHLKAVQEACK
jgi:tetratricopeptide (TPR) repeat protein